MVAQSAAAAAASATRSPAERPAAPSDPGVVVGAAVALPSQRKEPLFRSSEDSQWTTVKSVCVRNTVGKTTILARVPA